MKETEYGIKLDPWQRDFIGTEGDKILSCGRQIGKSVICSIDAGLWAVRNARKNVLIIAPTERQAYALFEKTLNFLTNNFKSSIGTGRNRPTQTRIILKNGTKIFCLPTGLAGTGIRFLTVHRLYADEAAYIPEAVWTAVTPMLLTTGGDSIMLSTPSGAENYFADVVENRGEKFNSFTRFSLSSREVIEKREICETWHEFQREKALEYLEREKERMTALQYAQEYEGHIISDLLQFFPSTLIRRCMTEKVFSESDYERIKGISAMNIFLGVDVARMGNDDTVLVEVCRKAKKDLKMLNFRIMRKNYLTEIAEVIKNEDKKRKYRRIYIDDAGVGAGVFDILFNDNRTKRRTVGINNNTKSIDPDERRRKVLKEDLYNNLKNLMEKGQISLINDVEVFTSLSSVQFEFTEKGNMKLFGKYTHVAEALARAAWCMKDKSLNIFIHFS